ncbi:hypothetical protein SPRG_10178 [Saprolegnia parasitica CBS 223.65]|uniref:START domain-containing protein n=1 Tax=Saprolegnia parasitica (strain CBS 223.65) TaxID=695850 RepID=A0A067C674_SAPPC|nr:hypothetical protein SPRG_10178 [Saprolegnia parasitica CBS 223.65]KDO24645.1 hypothetical protein SPRG_10178 [Saprolegnia parasitica CBS 223.65]|eukprot:XP_012204713.1 hypothetical protein SPRG_10178 [Saprolegnia parasitica CBS 223.65]
MDDFRLLSAADLALHRSTTQAIAARATTTAQNQRRHPTYLKSQGYKLAMTKHGFQAFQRSCPNSSFMEFVILGHCDASLDEMAEGLYASTTQAHRTVQALLYKHSFLDGAVLQVADTKTLDDPFCWFGIKYARVQLHAMFQPRDTVYAELSGTTVEDGVRTLYQVRHSIEADAFPPLHNVVRFSYEMGWVFSELPNGRVQFSIVGHLNPQGKIPPWFFNKRTAQKHALNAATFSDIARLRRLVEAPPAPQHRPRDPT